MRKLSVCLLFLSFLSGHLYTQNADWKVLTTARSLTSINFVSSKKAWVFGGDILFKSTNDGLNWSLPIISNYNQYDNFNTVFFVDSLYGYRCYTNSIFLLTTNGGEQWIQKNLNGSFSKVNSVNFINRTTGWITGKSTNSQNQVAQTTNGGNNWVLTSTNILREPCQILMLNQNRGFVVLNSRDTIGITTNGGYNWDYKKVGNDQPVNKLFFIDSLTGWALGNYHYVSKTTDGGRNWIVYTNSIGNTINMFFLNHQIGWITDPRGRIWKSSDGGVSWFIQRNGLSGSTLNESYTMDVFFRNENTGWVSCGNGLLLKSTNGGFNWNNEINPPLGDIKTILFNNENTGWVLTIYGNITDFTYIYKTTNRGYNFTLNHSVPDIWLNSLDFVNADVGFSCGSSGKIIKTTNAGNNWLAVDFNTYNFRNINFIDEFTGYVCGENGVIIKTTNGGNNWNINNSGSYKNLNRIFLVNSNTAYIAADSGYVLKTTNGGVNWQHSLTGNGDHCTNVYFLNSNTGFIIKNLSYSLPWPPVPMARRTLLETTNAGINWNTIYSENIGGYGFITDIAFFNSQIGYFVCQNNSDGYIAKTTNSGINWTQDFVIKGNGSYRMCGLFSMYVLNENKIWVGGGSSTIITNSSPIGIHSASMEIPLNFSLSQNYPNPYNPQTKIKFAVPKASFTKLNVYDILGREVVTLVNEELKPGTYEADWDGSDYSSGVYLYKIISGDYTETRKMILMK